MSSAHVMKSSLICLLEYPPFVTSFVLSSEDQETGKRIGLNSHRCSCEELTRKYTGTDRIVKLFTLTLLYLNYNNPLSTYGILLP